MATRKCFLSTPTKQRIYEEIDIEFEYHKGFSITQKQKSIKSMHDSIVKMDPEYRVLEISTKSEDQNGRLLSAFNLEYFDSVSGQKYPIENVFQSSKVFENGGPYFDLLKTPPRDAKRDNRLISSGKIIGFSFNDEFWETEPKTMFYDWLYINSLNRNKKLSLEILNYNAFTDIEFNHKKSINCQARSAAIFVSLSKKGILEETIQDKDKFRKIYLEEKGSDSQLTFLK